MISLKSLYQCCKYAVRHVCATQKGSSSGREDCEARSPVAACEKVSAGWCGEGGGGFGRRVIGEKDRIGLRLAWEREGSIGSYLSCHAWKTSTGLHEPELAASDSRSPIAKAGDLLGVKG